MPRPPSNLRFLAASLLVLGLAGLWAPGCGEPATNPATDSAIATPDDASSAPDAGEEPADAAQARLDASSPGPDAAAPGADASGAGLDAAAPGPDAAAEPPDAAAPGEDAGVSVPLPGFGTITGTCGVLDVELSDGNAYYFENHVDFGTNPYDAADFSLLTSGGQEVLTDPNAGGSSQMSETFAFEMLARCELASLLKTEMEIAYDTTGAMTDFEVDMDALKIGVSVTRAMTYPLTNPPTYTVAAAQTLLEKKLKGVKDSTSYVSAADKWVKQVLYYFALSQAHADAVRTAWGLVSADLRADTVVFVTVTDGDDAFMYQ